MPEFILGGSVICLGSVLFLIAAFSPASRVFAAPSTEKKLAIINASITGWRVSQILFASGAIITAMGVAVASYALREYIPAALLYLPAALLLIGALAWSSHIYRRAVDPQAFVAGALPAWHFILYTLLTLAAFFLIGIAILWLGLPVWVGWVLVGGALLFSILYLVFKDLPPFVHYLLGLVLGVALILGA